MDDNRELDRPAEWLVIPAAAERLGISIESLRKRISRGQVRAHKDGARWYVQVSGDADSPPPSPRLAGRTNGHRAPDVGVGDDRQSVNGAEASSRHARALPVAEDPTMPWQEVLLRRDKEIDQLTTLLAESQETIRNLVAAAIAEGASRGEHSGALRTERARREATETDISLLRIYIRSLEETLRSRDAIGDRGVNVELAGAAGRTALPPWRPAWWRRICGGG